MTTSLYLYCAGRLRGTPRYTFSKCTRPQGTLKNEETPTPKYCNAQCKYLWILSKLCSPLFFSLAGISRSVTIVAAYIISVTGLSVSEALQAIRSSRTIANPNFGFQKQLFDFEVNGGAQKVSI